MKGRKREYGWGLIGPGRFAREFANELREVDRCRRVAVASRSLRKAESFAADFGFARAYGDYDSILADAEIDVIYIVVPHVFHREIAERALSAGKAVLCEKPLTLSVKGTRALTDLARRRGIFLMEAMKTAFLPAVREAKRWIEEGRIGEVRLAKADFCFRGSTDPLDRLLNPTLGGGAVLDVGIYPLFLTRLLLGEVVGLHASGTITREGVEDSAAILTTHESGASSLITCSFRTEEAMDASILGTGGEIRIPKFHAATRAELYKEGGIVEVFEDAGGGMVRAEIEAVLGALDSGLLEAPMYPHRDSVRLAEIMDQIREQLGVRDLGELNS